MIYKIIISILFVALVIVIHLKIYYHKAIKSIENGQVPSILNMLKELFKAMPYTSYEIAPIYFVSNTNNKKIKEIVKKIYVIISLYYIVLILIGVLVFFIWANNIEI